MFLKKYFINLIKYKFLQEFVVCLLFVFLPAIVFFIKNYLNSDWYIPELLLFSYLVIFLVILILLFNLVNINKFLSSAIVFLCFLYFLQFQNLMLYNLAQSINLSVSYLYLFIISLFLILAKLCYKLFIKFLFFFLTILLILNSYTFLVFYGKNFFYTKNVNLLIKDDTKNSKNIRPIDIIYIISDASLPFNKVFNKDEEIFYVKEFQKIGFKYFENSKSNFQTTSLTMTSILRLNDNFVKIRNKDNDELTTLNIHSKNLYPRVLENNYLNHSLFQRLKLQSIESTWIGNIYFNCKLYKIKNCSSKIDSKIFFYNNLLYKFISDSLIDRRFLKDYYRKYSRKYIFDTRDVSFNDLEDQIINQNNSRNFYLVHHFLPHEPYIYQDIKNCNIIDDKINPSPSNKRYYKIQYECNIKNVLDKINKIIEKKPNSIIVIQGDHGYFNYKNEILNLVKFPNICKRHFQQNVNNQVNTINAILNCIRKENL